VVLLAVSALPVTVVAASVYSQRMAEATRRMGERDPEDVDLVALAMYFRIPVWSNDDDFSVARVPWFTTAELMTRLGF
jgi:predicted nucleic acid-binding protein